MNTAAEVNKSLTDWLAAGLLKSEVVVKLAQACLGWPYVFGAAGEICNPSTRKKYYNNYINRDPDEAAQIKKRCQVLNGSKETCTGCTYYPGGGTRCYDCRGITRWVFSQVGIHIDGAGCTSQWNASANWTQKGDIKDMPDVVCCVFMQSKTDPRVMSHTGIHVGGGKIIHCSGTVKTGKTTDRGWTHYAIPKGLDGNIPLPTLRRGSRGEYVTYLQTKLIQLGYNVGKTGADGIFGVKTEEAVRDFQRNNGLTVDGVVGSATWTALEEGKQIFYTVTIKHVGKAVAENIVGTYGGTMTAEE